MTKGLQVNQPLEGEILPPLKFKEPKYTKDACQDIIYMAQNKKTISHFCVKYRITRTCFYKWREKYPEFDYAAQVAKEAYAAARQDQIEEAAVIDDTAKKVFINTTLINRLFNTAFESSSEPKEQAMISPIKIDLNVNGGTVERNLEKLEQLKEKLIQNKQKEE